MLTDLDDVFLATDEFADAVTYRNQYSEEETINGIFDEPHEEVNPVTGMVETTAPQIEVKSSDVVDAVQRETITRDGTTWYIIGIHPDGAGMTILILSQD